ncbi:hypothetical protein VNO77_15282 [Canavalia gladiata]|uniref:Uncharacterized protein n=1 Tax=Canavalia gladiata TaxID=3824 RepID=A0AAN9QRB0_CANGL
MNRNLRPIGMGTETRIKHLRYLVFRDPWAEDSIHPISCLSLRAVFRSRSGPDSYSYYRYPFLSAGPRFSP